MKSMFRRVYLVVTLKMAIVVLNLLARLIGKPQVELQKRK